jgi:hypothetical protein
MEAIKDLHGDRASVLDSVGSLSINFEIPSGQDVNEDGIFDDWCNYIAKNLDLEAVWFRIYVGERDLKRFVSGKKSGLNGLSATSKLRVSQYFDVTLELDDDSDADVEDYEAIVLEHMMPFSLRSWTSEIEEQRYLQARAGSPEETSIHPD